MLKTVVLLNIFVETDTFSLGFFDKFVTFDKKSIDFNQSINLTSSKHLNSSEV